MPSAGPLRCSAMLAERAPNTIPKSGRSQQAVLAVLVLAGLAYGLLQSMVAPPLPVLRHDLHSSQSGVAWIFTAYLLSGSIAMPVIGRLGDIHGKKRTLVVVLSLLAIGTVLSALASSLPLMIAGQCGSRRRRRPIPAGLRHRSRRVRSPRGAEWARCNLLESGYRGRCRSSARRRRRAALELPLAVLVAAVLRCGRCRPWRAWLVPESPIRASSRMPWRSAVVFSLGLAAVVVAISQGSTWGWGSSRTIGLLVTGFDALLVWAVADLRSSNPPSRSSCDGKTRGLDSQPVQFPAGHCDVCLARSHPGARYLAEIDSLRVRSFDLPGPASSCCP